MGDDGLADVIGYVAEDEIDEAMTVMVGLEGQPLRLEELISQTRRFRLVVGGERVGFAEWRGIGIPTE